MQPVPDLYADAKPLNKREIQRQLNLTYYYVDRAIELLKRDGYDIQPTVRPGRGNEKLFSPDQIRAIQQKVEQIIKERM